MEWGRAGGSWFRWHRGGFHIIVTKWYPLSCSMDFFFCSRGLGMVLARFAFFFFYFLHFLVNMSKG